MQNTESTTNGAHHGSEGITLAQLKQKLNEIDEDSANKIEVRARKAFRDLATAAVFKEMYFWSFRTKNKEGWFWKTADEWWDDHGLTRQNVKTARNKLLEAEVIEEKPGAYGRIMYRLLPANVILKLYPDEIHLPDSRNPICRNPAIPSAGIPRPNAESTQETTPERREPVGSPPQEEEQHVAKNSGKGEEKQHKDNGSSWAHKLAEKVEQAHGESLDDGERARYAKQFGNLTSKRSITDEQMQEVLVMISRKWDRTHLSPQLALGDVEKGEEPPPATAREEKQEEQEKERDAERKVLSALQEQGFPVTASEKGNYMLLPDGAKVGYGEIMVGNVICGGDDDDRNRPLMEWLDRNPESEVELSERQQNFRQCRRERRERLRRKFQERDEPFSPLENAMIEYLEKRPGRARQMPHEIAREVWQAGLIDHMPDFGEGNAEFEAIGGTSITSGVYPSEAMRSLESEPVEEAPEWEIGA